MSDLPVLVTGLHRSGTTWLGRSLCVSGQLIYAHEPFNPTYPPRFGQLRHPLPLWYLAAEGSDIEDRIARDVAELVSLRIPSIALLRRVRGPRDLGRIARGAKDILLARFLSRRILIKDPIAYFSTAWLERRFNAQVLVMVRHPAGFVSSVQRLGWTFDFHNMTAQHHLLDRLPADQAELVERYAARAPSMLDHAIALWNIVYSDLLAQRLTHPSWTVVRYETVASDPIAEFRSLYGELGLDWTIPVSQRIARDSLTTARRWRQALDAVTIKKIRDETENVASAWYGDADW